MTTEDCRGRWSDDKLETFHAEFLQHIRAEESEHRQQDEIYRALFQKADEDSNMPPGVIQLLGQMNVRLKKMETSSDRQKTFVGGVVFAFTCIGFFLTESAHKLMIWLRGV